MMRRVLLVLGVWLWAAPMSAQQTAVLRFVSPVADDYVSGVVQLLVAADSLPAGVGLDSVTYFADGREVCTVPRSRLQCTWDAGREIREHTLRAVATLTGGGRLVANVRTKALALTDTVLVDIVQVNVVVRDGRRFVSGLTKDAFRLLDDGRERAITNFEATGSPLEIIVALDVSGSMVNALPDLKAAVQSFVRALRPEDKVTLVAFNDALFTLARSETSAEVRDRAVDELNAWGGTAFYDVIVRSLELLSSQPGRQALVVFSDGDDSSSTARFEQVRERVSESGASFFAIGLGKAGQDDALRNSLEQLADAGGGQALFTEKSDRLDRAFKEILNDLSGQYTLSFEPPRDGRVHEIQVQVKQRDLDIRSRKQYKAPGPPVLSPPARR